MRRGASKVRAKIGLLTTLIIISLVLHPSVSYGQSEKIKIVATLEIYASIAKFIGGEFVETSYILPEGADPHDYSLTPSDLSKIEGADVLVLANSEFFTLEQRILDVSAGKLLIDFSDYEKYNVTVINLPGIGVNYHGYWIYPDNALAIAKAIREKLVLLDPDHKEVYDSNLEDFTDKILRLKSLLIKTSIENNLYGADSIVAVPGAAYVAYSFGLGVVASLLQGPGRFINATELDKIFSLAREGRIKVILCPYALKDGKPGEMSRQLSEDTGVPVAYVRVFSLSGLKDYFALMTYNAGVLASVNSAGMGGISMELFYWYLLAIGILFSIVFIESVMIFKYKRRAEVAWHE